ncbi:MAG: S8 family serine peptidase [Myxococcota bacterium]
MKHLSNIGAENAPAMGSGPVGGSNVSLRALFGPDALDLTIDRPKVSSPPPNSAPQQVPLAVDPEGPVSYRASPEVRANTRDRLRRDPITQLRQLRLQAQVDGATVMDTKGAPPIPAPKGGGGPIGSGAKGGMGGKGTGDTKPFGPAAKTLGDTALKVELPPDPAHPYVKMQADFASDLSRLGISTRGNARIHIDDLDFQHSQGVARTAAGKTSLAQGNEVSISIGGASAATRDKVLSADQRARLDGIPDRVAKVETGELSSDQMARLGADMLESTVLEKQMRLSEIRGDLPKPPDGKKTFVNMSWGQTGQEAAHRMTGMMLMAPAGSTAAKEVEAALGHPPTLKKLLDGRTEFDKAEFETIRDKIAYPKIQAALNAPEVKQNLDTARAGLEKELAEGRKAGILVFQAAGNSFERAGVDHPEMSRGITDGVKGLITVGATDINGPGKKDDAVAAYSSDGRIDLAAPGSKIPVYQDFDLEAGKFKTKDVDGTSFAAPYAVQVAAAMSAANPKLSVDDIAKRITDPRVLNDISGTTRDGGGAIDPVAAVLLAKNPGLTRAQIEGAEAALDGPKPDLAAIKKSLGL